MSADQETETLTASSKCPICGCDTPHAHHNDEAEIELVARPTFEFLLRAWLNIYLPAKRIRRGMDLGVRSWHRDFQPKFLPEVRNYEDPVIATLWGFWLGAWMSKPSWCNAFDNQAMQKQTERQSGESTEGASR